MNNIVNNNVDHEKETGKKTIDRTEKKRDEKSYSMFNGKYHNLYCIIVFDITYSAKCITEKYGKVG